MCPQYLQYNNLLQAYDFHCTCQCQIFNISYKPYNGT